MRIGVPLLAALSFVAGCATAPAESAPSAVTVPVYMSATEVPCEYVVLERLTTYASVRSVEEYQRQRDGILGRAAARVGADAVVIVGDGQGPGGLVGLAVNRAPGAPPSDVRISGDAIRLTGDDCPGAP